MINYIAVFIYLKKKSTVVFIYLELKYDGGIRDVWT
jgi:hypothetical protein